eukprot:6208453-Pleurochrysis_carterae.AAC.2
MLHGLQSSREVKYWVAFTIFAKTPLISSLPSRFPYKQTFAACCGNRRAPAPTKSRPYCNLPHPSKKAVNRRTGQSALYSSERVCVCMLVCLLKTLPKKDAHAELASILF